MGKATVLVPLKKILQHTLPDWSLRLPLDQYLHSPPSPPLNFVTLLALRGLGVVEACHLASRLVQ